MTSDEQLAILFFRYIGKTILWKTSRRYLENFRPTEIIFFIRKMHINALQMRYQSLKELSGALR